MVISCLIIFFVVSQSSSEIKNFSKLESLDLTCQTCHYPVTVNFSYLFAIKKAVNLIKLINFHSSITSF
ncbi:hypothetical protein D104_03485 [Marinomonas profundimaris]|uniref:Uncharacterized protein n=1 Tax=Marinomonas profundimaris TaxID=1208321 RepID=W1S4F1_9GAMM|nr:hypothetical protein D104_03485 [Marinomonas profundimaris]